MKYIKYLFLICYIFIIGIIFSRSLESGTTSANSSSKVTEAIVEVIDIIKQGDESIIDIYGKDGVQSFVRKAIGHFVIFLILGIFATISYYLFIKNRYLMVSLIFLSGFIIATISELLQFIPRDRGPSINDVLIDYSGYLVSVVMFLFIYVVKNIILVNKKKLI